jgi:Ser/Thr protein kinase RdoA (MazF antagonist)
LEHLHSVGFRGAPRPFGLDEHGREVLSFAPGSPVWPDRFDLVEPRDRLAFVGRLVRRFHDAVADFTPPPDAEWHVIYPQAGSEIIAHHDLAPWNLIAGDKQWVFIDWDAAAPGTRLWDLAYAAHGFVPLSADPALRRSDAGQRLRALVDGYGLGEPERRELVALLAERTRAMYDFLAVQAARGVAPWDRLWREGHGEVWLSNTGYICEHQRLWERSLLT